MSDDCGFRNLWQMVRKEAGIIFAEIGKSYIQNMSFMYLQYKYNIPEMCKTTIRINCLKFADTCGKWDLGSK